MKCENCGAYVVHNQRACSNCLRKVNPKDEDFEPDIIHCPKCDCGVSPNQPYCVFCGTIIKVEEMKVQVVPRIKINGLSVKQIANKIKVSEGSIYKRLRNGLDKNEVLNIKKYKQIKTPK